MIEQGFCSHRVYTVVHCGVGGTTGVGATGVHCRG